MYLKVEKGSWIYDELYRIFTTEENRYLNYLKWLHENLPPHSNKVRLHASPFEIYPTIIAWQFVGDFDPNTWQPSMPDPDFYVPNLGTQAGIIMHGRILEAVGKPFNRLGFFEIFEIDAPLSFVDFIFPIGFVEDEACFMLFDDAFILQLRTNMYGRIIEISKSEWSSMLEKHEMELKSKIKEVINVD